MRKRLRLCRIRVVGDQNERFCTFRHARPFEWRRGIVAISCILNCNRPILFEGRLHCDRLIALGVHEVDRDLGGRHISDNIGNGRCLTDLFGNGAGIGDLVDNTIAVVATKSDPSLPTAMPVRRPR